MDSEQLIYIVIVILWAALGWYNKKQKEKKKVQPSSAPSEKQESKQEDFKSILEEILMGSQRATPETKPTTPSVPLPHKVTQKKIKKMTPPNISHGTNDLMESLNSPPSIELSKLHASSDNRLKTEILSDAPIKVEEDEEKNVNIDLKQAVIFSEILKRPSY